MSNQTQMSKRSPSILVTDVRTNPVRPAPFAGGRRQSFSKRPKSKGNKFSNISVSGLLDGGGAAAAPAKRLQHDYQSTVQKARGIPQRTSKQSQKLVLIPDESPSYDDDDEDDDYGMPIPGKLKGHELFDLNTDADAYDEANAKVYVTDIPRRSIAERMSKDARDAKLPRVTAYCTAEGYRLKATAEFLQDNHEIRPRIYDEALFAPYYLPLLPGEDGCRVRSSPPLRNAVGESLMETLIETSENTDHHFEYYGADGEEPTDFSPKDAPIPLKEESTSPESSSPQPGSSSDPQSASGAPPPTTKRLPTLPDLKRHAELFIFSYGVAVFWNFTEAQEKEILADLVFASEERKEEGSGGSIDEDYEEEFAHNTTGQDWGKLGSRSYRHAERHEIETEEFHFVYSPQAERPRIFNDMITLRSGDHMVKLAMSHAIAQSTKLCRFEARMDTNMHNVKHVPKVLALTGKLGMQREDVLKMSGKLFQLRVDVNLSSNVLDTPDFFWEAEPSLHPLYSAVREYLEIDQRILVINERCKVFLDFIDIIADSIAEFNMSRITWIIIILIVLSLIVSGFEIAFRYSMLRRRH